MTFIFLLMFLGFASDFCCHARLEYTTINFDLNIWLKGKSLEASSQRLTHQSKNKI